MSFYTQATQQGFPFEYDRVFDGLCEILPTVKFSIKDADKITGRIEASGGISAFSWGENLTLLVEKIDPGNTRVAIESRLKLGFNILGAGKHAKNFGKIIRALSAHLRKEE